MRKWQNENWLDRLIRVFLAELFLLAAYFWIGGTWQVILFGLGLLTLVTGISGICSLYNLFNINTFRKYPRSPKKLIVYLLIVGLILILVLGAYFSNFFTKKFFMEDYNAMNNYYKQTLFNTGQDKREESVLNYEKLVVEFSAFKNKYSSYKPFVIKKDNKLDSDLEMIQGIISSSRDEVYNGDLPLLHKKLEEIRPVFQDVLKRNGFSLLAVYLVDFHDAMEKVIAAADNKDAQGVLANYAEANDKLIAVEEVANDDEIKIIRENLDAVLKLAVDGRVEELSKRAAELKSSFVKVYLKRG